MRTNIFILTFLFFITLTVLCSWTPQSPTITNCTYIDTYGNKITIENIEKLPDQIDTTFIKSNITGLCFNKKQNETSKRFSYTIAEIKTIKRKKIFELRVYNDFITNDIGKMVMCMGYAHYRMTVKKVDNKLQIGAIYYVFAEI